MADNMQPIIVKAMEGILDAACDELAELNKFWEQYPHKKPPLSTQCIAMVLFSHRTWIEKLQKEAENYTPPVIG